MKSSLAVVLPLVLILAAVVFQITRNKSRNYRCDKCGKEFPLSSTEAILAPHSFGKKLVKCPQCGGSGWVTPVSK